MFDDKQRLELLRVLFVPCTESSGGGAVAGTLVVSPFSSIALHFYLHKYSVKQYFSQFPVWLGMVIQLGFANVI